MLVSESCFSPRFQITSHSFHQQIEFAQRNELQNKPASGPCLIPLFVGRSFKYYNLCLKPNTVCLIALTLTKERHLEVKNTGIWWCFGGRTSE